MTDLHNDEKVREILATAFKDVGMGSGWARNVCNPNYEADDAVITTDDKWMVQGAILAMHKYAALIQSQEQERCAKIAEEYPTEIGFDHFVDAAIRDRAKAIRAQE